MEEDILKPIADYWFDHYQDGHCTLCGNRGIVDTRGVATAAGVVVGRLNFCICPNGQVLRKQDPEALAKRESQDS